VLIRINDFEWFFARAHPFLGLEQDNAINQTFAAAAEALKDTHWNDREVIIYRDLIAHGLEPMEIKSGPTCLASLLCKTLLAPPPRGGRHQDPEDDRDAGRRFTLKGKNGATIQMPRSEILLWFISQMLHVNIYVFSSRKQPHCFLIDTENAPAIGLLHMVNTVAQSSSFITLCCNKHELPLIATGTSQPLRHTQPSISHTPFQSLIPPAIFRNTRRIGAPKVARTVISVDDMIEVLRSAS
ncbi:hypothetical protein DFQ26_001945, partial [Actinomortierella ambigua]